MKTSKLNSIYTLRVNRQLRIVRKIRLDIETVSLKEKKLKQHIQQFDDLIVQLQDECLNSLKLVSDINKIQDKIAYINKKKNSQRMKLLRTSDQLAELKKKLSSAVKTYVKISFKKEKIKDYLSSL